LHNRLKLWQGILHLDTWNVTLEVTPRTELRAGTVGNIRWDDEEKSARKQAEADIKAARKHD